jgi:hypothetical protein
MSGMKYTSNNCRNPMFGNVYFGLPTHRINDVGKQLGATLRFSGPSHKDYVRYQTFTWTLRLGRRIVLFAKRAPWVDRVRGGGFLRLSAVLYAALRGSKTFEQPEATIWAAIVVVPSEAMGLSQPTGAFPTRNRWAGG